VIEDMVEVFYQLLQKKASGIFHVTNPGTLKHREIIELYKEFVDPNKNPIWIAEEEMVKEGLVEKMRSTNKLQSENLEKLGIRIRVVHEAARETMKRYAELVKKY
jgi:nucleoside-diphosphate-sugar epimerase